MIGIELILPNRDIDLYGINESVQSELYQLSNICEWLNFLMAKRIPYKIRNSQELLIHTNYTNIIVDFELNKSQEIFFRLKYQ